MTTEGRESLTASLRRRLSESRGICPTCGQPRSGESLRALGAATGIPFTVLARFLRGGEATGRTLDAIDAYLSLTEEDNEARAAQDAIDNEAAAQATYERSYSETAE